ncbi:MAG: NAD-dependent epimerase/dehydratase family protein [Ilumatobacteraceae bacterium]
MKVLVTGATGLVGANVCARLVGRGDDVVALVRDIARAAELRALGVELALGDVTDPASVTSALRDASHVVHAAALLGGATQDIRLHESVNTYGSRVVLDAAAAAGVVRSVVLSSHVVFDPAQTITCRSTFPELMIDTAYASTKRMALVDAQRRVDQGADIVVVVPGGVYGPSPVIARSLERTSVNSRFTEAIVGRVRTWVRWTVAFVFVDDVTDVIVRSLSGADAGDIHLAMGDPLDVMTLADASRRLLAMCGHEADVLEFAPEDVPVGQEDEYGGPSLVRLARRGSPVPLFDDAPTRSKLGVRPTRFEVGARSTLSWLRGLQLPMES